MLLRDIRPEVLFERVGEILYHREKGFPENLRLPRGFRPVMHLRYSAHAKDESKLDRYGKLTLPDVVDVRKGDIFEIGVINGTVTKMAVRFPYNDELDLTIVLNPADGFVRTVWANRKSDKHRSLDLSKYAEP